MKAVETAEQLDEAQEQIRQNKAAIDRFSSTPLFDKREPLRPTKAFEFHGYGRSGYGINERGGPQTAFQAPGALAIPAGERSGNVRGAGICKQLAEPGSGFGKGVVQDGSDGHGQDAQPPEFDPSSDFRFREMFVQGGNLFSGRLEQQSSGPEIDITLRQDIHITDFWYTDLSGYGGGVEDSLGKARASLAYIGSTHPSTPNATTGNVSKSTVDARVLVV